MLDLMSFKKEFISNCRNALCEYGPEGMRIEEQSVNKAQRGKLNGMLFVKEGLNCAPTLYVEDFYAAYKAGNDIKDLSRNAIATVVSSMGMASMLADKTHSLIGDRRNLGVRLVNKHREKDYLKGLLFRDIESDFGFIADIQYGEYRLAVTRDMPQMMKMSEDEIFETALKNTMEKYPAVFYDLKDSVFCYGEECTNLLESGAEYAPAGAGPGYVITNSSFYRGASALFYPGIICRIHLLLDDDFYVLPSSVHEVIIIAAEDQDPRQLAEMIRSANRTVVDPEDVLADDLYICESGMLRRVSYGGVIPDNPGCMC